MKIQIGDYVRIFLFVSVLLFTSFVHLPARANVLVQDANAARETTYAASADIETGSGDTGDYEIIACGVLVVS